MLSYRHAFHAGNHADILKHTVLVLTLDYYLRKDKPFCYIDTHAGSGMYTLTSAAAQKTREFEQGVQSIWNASSPPSALQPYLNLIHQLNPSSRLLNYPGSPWLAAQLLRPIDQLRLFELHPTDFKNLEEQFKIDRRVQTAKQDGLKGLIALLPIHTRRAVTLIDPSYELKTDYTAVIDTLIKAHQRLANGTYLLWYPVISRQRVNAMIKGIQQANIPDVWQVEFCPTADNEHLGMTGSGLFVVNPPWLLAGQMRTLLPWMAQHMSDDSGHTTVQQLTHERKN